MTLEWFGDKILRDSKTILNKTSEEVAENVMADSKKILKQKANTTTERGLLSQFYIEKSKFKDGGYVVYCQGPKDWEDPYHASYVELGTYKDEAKPFMRPGYKKNRIKANKLYQSKMDKL